MRLDDQDKAALRALDEFTISADGETATVAGEMEVCVVRPADDDGARFSRSGCPVEMNSTCGYGAFSCWISSISKRTNPEK
jgi:hypothetical protein